MVDPLGGSWYIEKLTDDVEHKAEEYFSEIEALGGVVPAIEQGFFQREIARSASDYQNKVDEGKRIVVGVNKFVKENEEIDIPILEIGSEAGQDQLKKLSELKKDRNNKNVEDAISKIRKACKEETNLMYPIIDAAKKYVTLGEIVHALKGEFGEWQESAVF